jgi:aryl-alcohol dehydrogenase-like predicted oxidoreductase
LRYAAHAPGVAACLVGGTSLAHLQANVAAVARGAPSADGLAALEQVHRRVDWHGVI